MSFESRPPATGWVGQLRAPLPTTDDFRPNGYDYRLSCWKDPCWCLHFGLVSICAEQIVVTPCGECRGQCSHSALPSEKPSSASSALGLLGLRAEDSDGKDLTSHGHFPLPQRRAGFPGFKNGRQCSFLWWLLAPGCPRLCCLAPSNCYSGLTLGAICPARL